MTMNPTPLRADLRHLSMSSDPRERFDALQREIAGLRAQGRPVPAAHREAAADLEAEIIEAFYDNLPV